MRRSAHLDRHAVHPVLVVFPLGLFALSLAFDAVALMTEQGAFGSVATADIAGGVALGLIAAVFGMLDLRELPQGSRAARIGLAHATMALTMLALFGASLATRIASPSRLPSGLAVGLSLAGIAFSAVVGALGGALVDRIGVQRPGAAGVLGLE